MVDPVIGPVMRAISLFVKVGIELYKIHSKFESRMKSLIDLLQTYAPVVQKLERKNDSQYRDFLRDLRNKLEDGRSSIEECLKVSPVQLKKKYSLTKKVDALIDGLNLRLGVVGTYAALDGKKRDEEGGALEKFTCDPPACPEFTFGLDKPLEELKMKLLTEENGKKSVIVLTAPGGFGKTTLVKEFCHYKDVKDKFQNNIFFIQVPRYSNLDDMVRDEPDRRKNIIMDHIVEQLHRCMCSRLAGSSSQTQAHAVNKGLHHFLREAGEKPLLLVFDNVTPRSEFIIDAFNEIIGKTDSDCKILVTSRYDIPRFDSSYYLKSLKKEDAETCFNYLLGNESRDIAPFLKKKILEHCKGLPLAIQVVSSLLLGKVVQTWKAEEAKWSAGSILDSVSDLLDRLQSSLDENKAIVKECFIDLGVFLKDQTIAAAALIDMWTELHDELKGEDYESIANLHELTERSFAYLVFPRRNKTEVAEDDSYYSQHFVAQHDILRDLAIRQSNWGMGRTDRLIIDVPKNCFPQWWTKNMYHQPLNSRLISISTVGKFSKEWDKMKLPKAEVLILHFQAESYALPNFLKTMSRSLKVLIITNHGLSLAKVNKFGLLNSLSQLKRIRLEGISIPSVKKKSIKVNTLQKISFFMCNFVQPSSRSYIRIFETFPNLVEMNIDYCNNLMELPAKLCGLVSLKKLSITNCDILHALPEDIGNLVKLEVLRLLACIKLSKLPCSTRNLTNLKLIDISDCWSIEELPDIGEMHYLENLIMRHCPALSMLPQSKLNLQNLQQEMNVICDEKTKKIWDGVSYGSNIHIQVKK